LFDLSTKYVSVGVWHARDVRNQQRAMRDVLLIVIKTEGLVVLWQVRYNLCKPLHVHLGLLVPSHLAGSCILYAGTSLHD